jgi:hypothetical protein
MTHMKPILMAISAAALTAVVAPYAAAEISMTYTYSENPGATEAAKIFEANDEGHTGEKLKGDFVLHGGFGGDRGIAD